MDKTELLRGWARLLAEAPAFKQEVAQLSDDELLRFATLRLGDAEETRRDRQFFSSLQIAGASELAEAADRNIVITMACLTELTRRLLGAAIGDTDA